MTQTVKLFAGLIAASVFQSFGAGAADVPAAASVVQTSGADSAWSVMLNSELRYFSWSGSRGDPKIIGAPGGGSQFYMPTSLLVTGGTPDFRIDAMIRGGYVSAQQTTPGAQSSISTPTDTLLSGTFTYLGINGFQPFLSLNFNLPTGKAAIYGVLYPPRMDPDFVDVPTYGEGFNTGASLGVNIPISENMLATLSAGYTWRGQFNQEGFFAPTFPQFTNHFTPGNIFSLNGSLTYAMGALTAQLAASFSVPGQMALDGTPQSLPGQNFGLSGFAAYKWNDEWSSKVTGSINHTEKNKVYDFVLNALVLEAMNSNANVYRMGLETSYTTGALTVGPTFSVLYRDHNSWDFANFNFIPAKTRYSVGAQGSYALSDKTSLNARADYIWADEATQILAIGIPAIARRGVALVAGGTIRF